MNRRLINLLKTSLGALSLGVLLCACPAGLAPTGTFSGNRDASSVTSTDAKESDSSLEGVSAPGDLPAGAGNPFPIDNKIPASGGSDSIGAGPISSPNGGAASNPIIADAGGITARPDEAAIGRLPFVAGARRIWTGIKFSNETAEGGVITVIPNAQGAITIRVIAEYRPAQNMLTWFPYPAGMQVRLIWTPKNSGPLQSKHYDTVILPIEDGARTANIVVEDFPMEEGTLSVFTYEAAFRDGNGDYLMMRTPDFSEGNLVEFPNIFSMSHFFNSMWTHLLFTVEVKPTHQLPFPH